MAGANTPEDRPHFLCYQYNAFEFIGIAEYHEMTDDRSVLPLLGKLAEYLSGGVTDDGACRYDCHHATPEVVYYGAALAAALSRATEMGLGEYADLSNRGYDHVLSLQRRDGNMAFYSTRNYGLLSDRRSYPRYLTMILYHLLLELQRRAQTKATAPTGSSIRSSDGVVS